MSKKSRKRGASSVSYGELNPDAAGIDIGATELYVAVPKDRDADPIRCYGSFTEDIHELGRWLKSCNIKTVAMESTGVYWIPVLQILEQYGFEVCLVNARHVKNVPGRKTDVLDCQWLQYLHSVGLLRGSFRPADEICVVRSLLRHRDNLVEMSSRHIQHMQKALTQMNVQLHHVITDITGVTGQAILNAIVDGERDPNKLAAYRDHRVKASEATIAKALVGDYRSEHLFTLKQAMESYRHFQKLMVECDKELERQLGEMEARSEKPEPPPPSATEKRRGKPKGNQPNYDLRRYMHRLFGTDLTLVPGVNVLVTHKLFSEVGPDLSKFPTMGHFTSWIGLSPHNKISGGRILRSSTLPGSNRAAQALRIAAQSLSRHPSYLGDFYRRMRSRNGARFAVVAAAHKLARIIYHLIQSGESYDESVFAKEREQREKWIDRKLKRQAKASGYELIPVAA